MKKNFTIILLTSILLTGCVTHRQAVSELDYMQALDTLNSRYEAAGYHLTGHSNDYINDPYAKSDYSSENGWSTQWINNFSTLESYHFVNDNGDYVTFTIRYQLAEDKNNVRYMENLTVAQCEVSNTGDYIKLCRGNSSPTMLIQNAPPTTAVKVRDRNKTFWTALGVTFGLVAAFVISIAQ